MGMNKDKRAELIAALVTDSKYSGFKEGDEPFLETASDERLAEFKSASEARKSFDDAHTKLETDQRNVSARLKVAEDKLKSTEEQLKAAQQKPTKEEWLAQAPAEIKALLDAEEKRNADHRAELVNQLKTAQSEFSEADLNNMEISMLEKMVRMHKTDQPDYSAREIPVRRSAASKEDKDSYAPPNPYERDIKVLQQKTVN